MYLWLGNPKKGKQNPYSFPDNIFVVIDIISDFLNKSNLFMNFKNEISVF